VGLARVGLARVGLARVGLARVGLARVGLARVGLARVMLVLLVLAAVGSGFKLVGTLGQDRLFRLLGSMGQNRLFRLLGSLGRQGTGDGTVFGKVLGARRAHDDVDLPGRDSRGEIVLGIECSLVLGTVHYDGFARTADLVNNKAITDKVDFLDYFGALGDTTRLGK
jgi:hypothetical protein